MNESGVRTTSTYYAANQLKYALVAGGRTTYVYDANGNQRVTQEPSGARTTNVWDYENRMTKAILPTGLRNTMTYDPDGLRVRLDESTGSKLFLWDGQRYLATMNASGVIEVTYTNEPTTYGNLVSDRKAGATTYYQFDALGSTRTLTDASQNVLQQYSYGAWGNILGSPSLLTPFLWVGQVGYHWDSESQNQYVRARYYRPTIARWVSVDPIWPSGGAGLYRYGLSAPIFYIDATGLVCSPTAAGINYVPRGRFKWAHLRPYDPTDDYTFGLVDYRQRVGSQFGASWSVQASATSYYSPNPFEYVDPQTGKTCCCCDQIGFVQIVQERWGPYINLVTRHIGAGYFDEWRVDGGLPYPKGTTAKPCTITGIDVEDSPIFSSTVYIMQEFEQEFELCVVCLDGIEGPLPSPPGDSSGTSSPRGGRPTLDGLTVYGCIQWEHKLRRSISLHGNVVSGRKVRYKVITRSIRGGGQPGYSDADGNSRITDDVGRPPSSHFSDAVLGHIL